MAKPLKKLEQGPNDCTAERKLWSSLNIENIRESQCTRDRLLNINKYIFSQEVKSVDLKINCFLLSFCSISFILNYVAISPVGINKYLEEPKAHLMESSVDVDVGYSWTGLCMYVHK